VACGFTDKFLIFVVKLGTIYLFLCHVPNIIADDPCTIAIVLEKAVLFGLSGSSQQKAQCDNEILHLEQLIE
jgi:type I restriction-modification system DNA methylase subunit